MLIFVEHHTSKQLFTFRQIQQILGALFKSKYSFSR